MAVGPNVERPNLEERAAIDEEERGQGPATKDVVFQFIGSSKVEISIERAMKNEIFVIKIASVFL